MFLAIANSISSLIKPYISKITSALAARSDYYENIKGTNNILFDFGVKLLNKASIVLTPTAYSDGSLNTVIPPYGFGSELVTNGDFSNGTSNWSASNASIEVVNGELKIYNQTSSPATASQVIIGLEVGKKYKVTATSRLEGSGGTTARVSFFGNIFAASTSVGQSVTESIEITATVTSATLSLFLYGTSSSEGYFDNISVKEIQEADFDFSRGSSATRVNEQGLVEDVQILSGELVQNGNFEQIGSELVTNGNFETDSDWIKETGWTISDGKANKTNTVASNFAQLNTGVFTNNNIYKITFTISNSNDGRLLIYIGGNSATIDITNATNGTHTFYGKADGQNYLIFRNVASGFQGSIDNVSVKEVGQNWDFVGDFETDGTKAFITSASQYSQLTNQIGVNYLLSGNKYRLTFEIPTLSISNAFAYRYTGGTVIPISNSDIQDGRFTTEFIMPSNGYFWLQTTGSYTGLNVEIDNVSVVKVTDDTDLPRIDFTDGTGSLLLEPQRTNLVTYSEDFSQWLNNTSNLDVPSNVTQTNPSGGSESGFINVNNGVSATKFIYESISTTSNIHTQSVFFKYHSRQWIQLLSGGTSHYANFDIQNGVVGNVSGCTATIKDYGSGWYRCTATLSSAGTPINFVIAVIDDDATSRLPVSTGTGSYYVWGAQTEVGDYATSYIVSNSGSATTRSADVANNSGNADLFNDSEGVLYAEIAALADDQTYREIAISDGTSNNRIEIRYTNTSNTLQSVIRSGGTVVMLESTSSYNITNFNKIAVSYKANEFKMYVNSTEVAVDTSGNAPTGLKELAFDDGNGANDFYGDVKCVAVFKEALSNDLLERLTGEGYESFRLLAEANNYTVI